MYAGTSNGCIFVVHKDGKHTLLQETHHDGETWGLSVSRSEPLLVSSGDDNKVMLWDLERKTLKSKRLIGEASVGKRRRTKRSGGASTTTTRYAEVSFLTLDTLFTLTYLHCTIVPALYQVSNT